MMLEGTVVNGVIVLTGGATLPEGARVRIELEDPDDSAPPPESYDRATELAILRESIQDGQAGRTRPAREALAELAHKYGLPLEPGE